MYRPDDPIWRLGDVFSVYQRCGCHTCPCVIMACLLSLLLYMYRSNMGTDAETKTMRSCVSFTSMI